MRAPEASGAAPVDVPPEAALSLARFLLDTFARRALIDVGLIAVDEGDPAPGIANGNRALHPDRSSGGARCGAAAAGR